MALCKCGLCGKPFNSLGAGLCAECMREADEAYVKVRKYIYQNPDKSDFASIAENTEVSEKILRYLIDQERIVADGGGAGGAKCKACGKKIENGTLCEQCRKKLISENLISSLCKMERPGQKERKIKPLHTQNG